MADFFDQILGFFIILWDYISPAIYIFGAILVGTLFDSILYGEKFKYSIFAFILIVLNSIFEFVDFYDIKQIEGVIYLLFLGLAYCVDIINFLSDELQDIRYRTRNDY